MAYTRVCTHGWQLTNQMAYTPVMRYLINGSREPIRNGGRVHACGFASCHLR